MMTTTAIPAGGWGPEGKRGAFSLTFDNFGEAAELEQGIFPADQPTGQHHSAAYVPTLLKLVEGLRVTWFIEAANVALYPGQLRSLRDAGHEIGMHAWRHENWGSLAAPAREDILRRSLRAWETLDIVPLGFRPPGGVMPEDAWRQLREAGLVYCSPLGAAGDSGVAAEGLASLPFAWHHVDFYMLEERCAPLRVAFGDPAAPFPMARWEAEIDAALQLARSGRHVSMIFHPFYFGPSDAMSQAVRRLIRTLQAQPDLWVAPCIEVARWLRQ